MARVSTAPSRSVIVSSRHRTSGRGAVLGRLSSAIKSRYTARGLDRRIEEGVVVTEPAGWDEHALLKKLRRS